MEPALLLSYPIRWLFRLLEITLTIGLIAFLTVLINGKGQRGDIAAKTTVVKLRSKVKLSDTIYADINSDYIPKYASVIELADVDISTVKEALASKKSMNMQLGLDGTTNSKYNSDEIKY